MGSRSDILGALKKARPFVGTMLEDGQGARLFRDFPDEYRLLDHFAERLRSLMGECYQVSSKVEAVDVLFNLLGDEDRRAVYLECPIVNELLRASSDLTRRLTHGAISQNSDISNDLFAQFDVGITGADYLIARTGSVVLRASTQGGRRISALPSQHIVLAYETQLIASLEDCLADLKVDPAWSSSVIITGPSRSAAIGNALVVGAHGATRLAVIVVRGGEGS